MATLADVLLGVALILGVFRRPVAWASAVPLALFAGSGFADMGRKLLAVCSGTVFALD